MRNRHHPPEQDGNGEPSVSIYRGNWRSVERRMRALHRHPEREMFRDRLDPGPRTSPGLVRSIEVWPAWSRGLLPLTRVPSPGRPATPAGLRPVTASLDPSGSPELWREYGRKDLTTVAAREDPDLLLDRREGAPAFRGRVTPGRGPPPPMVATGYSGGSAEGPSPGSPAVRAWHDCAVAMVRSCLAMRAWSRANDTCCLAMRTSSRASARWNSHSCRRRS
jgi:hypothetical protein